MYASECPTGTRNVCPSDTPAGGNRETGGGWHPQPPHTPLPLCDLAEPAENWKEETKVA